MVCVNVVWDMCLMYVCGAYVWLVCVWNGGYGVYGLSVCGCEMCMDFVCGVCNGVYDICM